MTAVGGTGPREQIGERPAAALDPEVGVRNEAVRLETGARHRRRAAGRLQLRRQIVLRPGHEADPLVPEVDQVLRRNLAGCALVDSDRWDVERVHRAVHEDDARTFGDEVRIVAVVAAQVRHLAGDEDHSFDPAVEEHVDVVDLAKRGARRVAENRGETARGGAGLDRLSEGREDRVRELRHEHADQSRHVAPAGRDVEELTHRALDAVPGLRPHREAAVGDPRGGGDADPCPPSDLSQGRHVP